MAQASVEKLEQIEPAKKERVISAPQNSVISPDYKVVKIGESQGEREPHLGEKEEGQSGSMERGQLHNKGGFWEGEQKQAKRTSLGKVEGSTSG